MLRNSWGSVGASGFLVPMFAIDLWMILDMFISSRALQSDPGTFPKIMDEPLRAMKSSPRAEDLRCPEDYMSQGHISPVR